MLLDHNRIRFFQPNIPKSNELVDYTATGVHPKNKYFTVLKITLEFSLEWKIKQTNLNLNKIIKTEFATE